MPTYEYVCQKCGHRFERFQSMSARPVRKCPECGARAAERIISSGGGLVFKGPGFYATDYRKPDPKKRDGGESAAGMEKKDAPRAKGEAREKGKGSAASDSEKG